MTIDDVLDHVAVEIDVVIERNRQRFEQSLIDNQAPPDHLVLLREWERDHALEWRARMLEGLRAQWLAGDIPPTVH